MESTPSQMTDRALVEATQRLSAEDRIHAFLAHNRLVMELYEAGRRLHPPLLPPDTPLDSAPRR